MFRELMVKRIGTYVGVVSIVYSGASVAMKSERGNLEIHGKNGIDIKGSTRTVSVKSSVDISKISYEDFDVTARLLELPFGSRVFGNTKGKMHAMHLDTNIPCIGIDYQHVDYASLQAVPYFIAKYLTDKAPSSVCIGAKDFFERVIVRNHENLNRGMHEIPDLDCLYYKEVGAVPHLFLRLSSQTRKKAEMFKQKSAGETIFVENGDVIISSGGKVLLDHVNIAANNIDVVSKEILNRASKMNANWIIRLVADEQQHETVINKWVRDDRGSHHVTHEEGVESVDDCSFVAQKVVQAGINANNVGVSVKADVFEDRAAHTTNMPAKTTLHNYAWEENDGLFSYAETRVDRWDDVLVPSRYKVNLYLSENEEEGSSLKAGYTIIDAGSEIRVIKDEKEDIAVDENHTVEVHEEKGGFSILGGVSVPDPTNMLKKMSGALESGNMISIGKAIAGAVSKGIKIGKDYKALKKLSSNINSWDRASTTDLLQVLSHFVHGPSVQFGHRSFDMKQSVTEIHGNTSVAPNQLYNNKRTVLRGDYLAENISIDTGTLITFDLPKTVDYEMSVQESGVSMDLLTFAIALINPDIKTIFGAGLSASGVSANFQSNRVHQEVHRPIRIQASNRLDIKAESGKLTQAQVKAGIVHAVFTGGAVLETLVNEKWSEKSGGSVSFGLGGFSNFTGMASALKDMALSAGMSYVDSGEFEKIIDDYACFVGEKEFYLKIGDVLQAKSAFVGHMNRDPEHERIEGEVQSTEVEQKKGGYNFGFNVSVSDIVKAKDFIIEAKNFIEEMIEDEVQEEVDHGQLNARDATKIIERKINEKHKEVDDAIKKVEKTADKITELDGQLKEKIKAANTNEKKAKVIVAGIEKINEEQALLIHKKPESGVQEVSQKSIFAMLEDRKRDCFMALEELKKQESVVRANEAVRSAKFETWSQIDSSYALEVDPDTIKLSNEADIRKAAQENVEREYKRYQDIAEANFRAHVRFHNGEGYSNLTLKPSPMFVLDDDRPLEHLKFAPEVVNSPKKRFDRLFQQELGKVGEDDVQRAARLVPFLGTYLDYYYGRISGREFAYSMGIEAVAAVVSPEAIAARTATAGTAGRIVNGAYKAASLMQFASDLKATFAPIGDDKKFVPPDNI